MSEKFANTGAVAITTLKISVGSTTATTIEVQAAAPPTALQGVGTFRIEIDAEELRVLSVAGKVWTVERGIDGTSAATHAAGASVFHRLTAGSLIQAILDYGASTQLAIKLEGGNASNVPTGAAFGLNMGAAAGTFSELQFRHDTAANWVGKSLNVGEIGFESDTGKAKVAQTGITAWNSLPYWGPVTGLTAAEVKEKFLETETHSLLVKGIPTLSNNTIVCTSISPLTLAWGPGGGAGGEKLSEMEPALHKKFLAIEAASELLIPGTAAAGNIIETESATKGKWQTWAGAKVVRDSLGYQIGGTRTVGNVLFATSGGAEWAPAPASGFTPTGVLAAGSVPYGTSGTSTAWTPLNTLAMGRVKTTTAVIATTTAVEDIFYNVIKANAVIKLPEKAWPTAGQPETAHGAVVFVENYSWQTGGEPGTVIVESNRFVQGTGTPPFKYEIPAAKEVVGFMFDINYHGWQIIHNYRVPPSGGISTPLELTPPASSSSDIVLKGATGQTAGLISALPKQINHPVIQAKKETGDTFPRYELRADGTMYGGGGTAAPVNKLDLGSTREGIVKVGGLELEGLLGYTKGNFIGFSNGEPSVAGQARDVVIDEATGTVYIYKATGTVGWYSLKEEWTKLKTSFPTADPLAVAGGFLGQSLPMGDASTAKPLTAGRYHLIKVMVPVPMTIHEICLVMAKNGVTLTEKQCYAGIIAGENVARANIIVKGETTAETAKLTCETEAAAQTLHAGEEIQLKGDTLHTCFAAATTLVSRAGAVWTTSAVAKESKPAGTQFEGIMKPGVLIAKTNDQSGLPTPKVGESWVSTGESAEELQMKLRTETGAAATLTLEPTAASGFVHVVLLANGTTMPELICSNFPANGVSTRMLNMGLLFNTLRVGHYKTEARTALESLTVSSGEYVKNTTAPFFWVGLK